MALMRSMKSGETFTAQHNGIDIATFRVDWLKMPYGNISLQIRDISTNDFFVINNKETVTLLDGLSVSMSKANGSSIAFFCSDEIRINCIKMTKDN